jgi:hypothetical protein
MQQIFVLDPEENSFPDEFEKINKILKNNGKVISVTANHCASGHNYSHFGSWLIVIEYEK